MSAKDTIHQAVKQALVKDGWVITHDPLTLEYEEVQVFVDLGAERVIAAEKAGEKIAVEVKSFLGPSLIRDIELALGQYVLYLSLLRKTDPDRRLYLAVSHVTYDGLFQGTAIQELLTENRVFTLVVNVTTEEIREWK
jgi:hypothetical protein